MEFVLMMKLQDFHRLIIRQQGEYESLHQFSPLHLENPFPNREGSVHLWHGNDDLVVPVSLPRHIARKLPWIQYHELPGGGHMFPYADGIGDAIIKSLGK